MTAVKTAIKRWVVRRHQQGHRHDLVLAFYGFITGCAITGGLAVAIAIDRARIAWNAWKAARS